MEPRAPLLRPAQHRSHFDLLLSACLTLPLSWVLGRVAVLATLHHDCLVVQQQQQQAVCMGSDAATPWCPWRGLVSASNWAAVEDHPGDLGLVAAVLLPWLLAALLVAGLSNVWRPMPPAVVRLLGDAGSAGAAALFSAGAVARLLPMACSMLVVLAGWVGLLQQHSAAQALQLLHPATAVLTGVITLLSQASVPHTLAVSVLHTALAGLLLLTTDPGPSPPGYLTPAQAFGALLLLDVCIPAAAAWWWRPLPAQAAAAKQPAGVSVAAPAAKAKAAAAASEDSSATLFAASNRRSVQHAAEPASPGVALSTPAQGSSGQQPGLVEQSSTAAAQDPHLLQPCTPPGLSRDSSPSPNRQQSTTPPPSPAAAGSSGENQPPPLSFEDAVAACARGVAARRAAGSNAPTMLYQSKLHHHVVSIKAPLDAALEGQALMQLVINHLHAASPALNPTSSSSSSTNTASPVETSSTEALVPSDPCGRPLMLRPVAMRGCLHMLLPVCLTPSAAAAAAGAGSSCVFDQPGEQLLKQLAAISADTGVPAHARSAASGSGSSSTQLYLQVDQGEPQLVAKRPDGSWDLGRSSTAAAAGSVSTGGTGSTAAPADSNRSSADDSMGCWLEPSCVLQPSSAAPASGASSSTAGRVSVTVKGLPAAASTLVRVLLVQGTTVVADQLLSATFTDGQAQEGAAGTRTVRLSLPAAGLAAGPAMVCVLSPPSSITAAASAPAGVSPAVAALIAQQGHHPTDSSSAAGYLQPARVWACLPLLVVSSTEAQQDLLKLFDGMCRELQQQSADTCSSPGPSSSSSTSKAGQTASVHHWQPFLWDWLYAAHGAGASSMLGCIPQLAGVFRAPAISAVPLLGSTHEPAAVWATDISGSSSTAAPTKQAILSNLLDLLVTHELWAAVQELQAATAPAKAAPASQQGSPLADSSNSSIQPLSLTAGSRHDSFDSYTQIDAPADMAGWRPPVHCRDAVMPPLSLRQQALQEQQAKYAHTLEEDAPAQQHSCPALPSRRQSLEGGAEVQAGSGPGSVQSAAGSSPRGEGRQPAARRASASAVVPAPAGLFTPHRLSLDSLVMPHTSAAADTELRRPPRWSVDLPMAHDMTLQQHLQQQQLFIPPSAMFGTPPSAMFGTGLLSTTSPPAAAGALGGFGRPGYPAAGAAGLASPLPTHVGTAAAAAAAAAGAAAAQAALHLTPGSFGSCSSTPGSSLPSPAAAMRAPGLHSGPSSASRQFPHSVPSLNPALPHMHPQPSLGYTPSLASSASGGTSLFMSAADAAAAAAAAGASAGVSMGGSLQAASPAAGLAPRRVSQEAGPGSEDAATVEGRHWAVFDTTGVEGFDQGVDTAATNLATTARRNLNSTTASSVTWLAIPTSQTHLGLPPTALRTPRAARKSGTLYSSSTGKLRRHPDHSHSVSSSLTPQPPRSQAFSHYTAGGVESSAEYLATGGSHASGALSMPGHAAAAARRQSARTMLFSPAQPSSGATAATGSSSQFQSFTGSPEGRFPVAAGSTGTGACHMGGFSTPQRPGPAKFVGASPRRGGGMWSPGHQLNTLPTIGSEDSWDQNAQATPSPAHQGVAAGVGTSLRSLNQQQQQQQQQGAVGDAPLQPLPRLGGLEGAGWAAASPGRFTARPPLGAVAAMPRGGLYRSQQGAATPGYGAAGRTGAWVSGTNLGGGGGGEEGNTVSGVLQLLGAGPEGGDSKLQAAHSAALSGFSSSDSSLAGTPDGLFGLQQGAYQAGYFTPVRPNRGSGAALLPASARPASRTVAWAATPAASGRNLPPGVSGSGFFAVGASGTGHAASGAAAAGQQQVPDTPLLKAGRSIAGSLFSPAPAVFMGAQRQQQQQQQRIMSTPSHIQSLLPPPGSASKLKPAAALLSSAAVTGGAMHPAGSFASLSTSAGPGQSSAAAAAALLQLSPSHPGGSSVRPPTPQAPDAALGPASGALTSCSSSAFDMQPQFLQSGPLTEADMHTPVQSPRAGTPTGSPAAAAGGVGGSGSSVFSPAPPAAPARPMPAVVLVPALEAVESLYGSDEEGFEGEGYGEEGFDGHAYVGDGFYSQGYIPEGYAVGL